MIEDLFFLERQAYRDSVLHRLDARAKILSVLAVIIGIVAVPYSTAAYLPALLRVLDGVVEKVEEHLMQPLRVGAHGRDIFRDFRNDRHVLLAGALLQFFQNGSGLGA